MAREQIGHKHPEGSVAPGLGVEVAASGGASRTLTIDDADSLNLMDDAAGITYTLPVITAATVGMTFHFYVSVTVSSNNHVINTANAAQFIGGVLQTGVAAADENQMEVGDETSDVTITMNGAATGGMEGTFITVTALSATAWIANGLSRGTTGLSTPFA